MPDQLLSIKNILAYEEIAHPFLQRLNVLLPRFSNWSSVKSCVVELRVYSLEASDHVLDNIVTRVRDAMPDIYASGKLRILTLHHRSERWRQDMCLSIRLVSTRL